MKKSLSLILALVMVLGMALQVTLTAHAESDRVYMEMSPEDYLTVSKDSAEKLACGPSMVVYGDGNFAVSYLADEINTVETEASTTIVCRLGLFNLLDPEQGTFFDIATAGQNIGDVTIGDKAPYEPNLLKLSDDTLFVLFNIRDTSGNYIYYGAEFDTTTQAVVSYQPLTLDGKSWTPANIATSYNAISEKDISTSGPAGSMVFTSKIVQYEGYFYGYCGGICAGFSGILVRSTDGINWESVIVPEATADMNGVIECGFQFLNDTVYFCMRDISSGVYQCSYRFTTCEQLVKTEKLSNLTTSKPAALIQDGKMYVIVNKATGDDHTVGRRNTALIYHVEPELCKLSLVKQVFCADGCAYHTVEEFGGVNYWCFHTDARRINPYTQGRSNLAFLEIPSLDTAAENGGALNFDDYADCYGRGCITVAANIWQAGAVNMHYQIPLCDFAGCDTVTVTANSKQKAYIAFFTTRMTREGAVAYAEGWMETLIMEPGTTQILTIPSDAQYMYILATNAAGNSLIPSTVEFHPVHSHRYDAAVTPPTCTEQGYTTYTCTTCGDSYVDEYVDALGHSYSGTVCTVCGYNLAGKTVSILGDSISTFGVVSNDANSNSTIGSNATYYSGQGGISRADTWWQQVIDVLDMELLVNNSWSGSCVFQPRKGEASVGYTDRCVNLHNDYTSEEPDVILVFLGTNDYKNYSDTVGAEVDVDYNAIITDNNDGTYTYATATTTCEAYAIMLHKMSVRYPNADIYCMSLLPRKTGPASLTKFNQDIAVMAERFGCSFVDLEHCGITPDVASMEKYMYDGKVHPNAEGMDLISQAVLSALLGKKMTIHDVDVTLSNVFIDNNDHACIDNTSYSATLKPLNVKENISVAITMDGEDITASAYNNGNIIIESVTGDIEIVASASRGPITFRWEFINGELVSIADGEYTKNTLLKQQGSSTDGVFEDTYYRTQHTVMLMHDEPWALEWKGAGSGGFMFSDATSAASSSVYFRRHTIGYLHVFGAYDGNQYNHYGVKPDDYGFDVQAVHTYRMENHIGADGSNMVYFFVDGVEIGAMNNYYVGYVSQGIIDNWISGKDFCINYIGTSTHPLDAYSMEYIQIWESGYTHSYTSTVTEPTCTEQGYTTYTCAICGDSHVDDYVDALGHEYSAGLCTVCEEDTVTASLDGNILTLTGELAEGTRIPVACYDSDGRFVNVRILIWQGSPIIEEIPLREKVKLFFVNENWSPLRQPISLR